MELEIQSYIKGYHEYQLVWDPEIGEILGGEREPSNVKDKFAVAIMKNGVVVGHLKKGQSGWFAKTISYFLKAAESNSCNVKIGGNFYTDPGKCRQRKGRSVPRSARKPG